MDIRREPFRLFFPLGAILGLAGVSPWLLFWLGILPRWPGAFHALTMTQSFLVAVAVGFLGTMIPRRTEGAPMSPAELSVLVVALISIPASLALDRLGAAALAHLVVLGTLAQFAMRRLAAHASPRRPPPSFALLPVGLVAGATGSGLLLAYSLGAPTWALASGRSLVQEGLLLGLVLALGPMLTSIIAHDRPLPDGRPTHFAVYAVAGVALLASFAVQHAVSERLGFAIRGVLLAIVLAFGARAHLPPTVPGLHRRLFRLALMMVPVGPLAAAFFPSLKIPMLHFTFIGGLSLLVFAVTIHVTLLHTGRETLARRSPWPVALVGVFTAAALAARVNAEHLPSRYFAALAVASSLWLVAAILWLLFVVALLARRAK
jgi:uncharacterized protein involved in response to NO